MISEWAMEQYRMNIDQLSFDYWIDWDRNGGFRMTALYVSISQEHLVREKGTLMNVKLVFDQKKQPKRWHQIRRLKMKKKNRNKYKKFRKFILMFKSGKEQQVYF